jgi:hypothetical protein
MLDSFIYAGVVDQDVDAAECGLGRVEQAAHRARIAHIGLGGQRAPARSLDLAGHGLGGRSVARIVDDDRETIAGQPLRHRSADASRGADDDRYLAAPIVHIILRSPPSCRSNSRDARRQAPGQLTEGSDRSSCIALFPYSQTVCSNARPTRNWAGSMTGRSR